MKVILRADASHAQGTGHVMRCVALSEALLKQGHEVALMTNNSGIPWLEQLIANLEYKIFRVEQHSIDFDLVRSHSPDWLVTDSFEIQAETVSLVKSVCKSVVILDGSTRGIDADLYLDQNMKSFISQDELPPGARLLEGNRFLLLREAVFSKIGKSTNGFNEIPRIVAFAGGSDPTNLMVDIADVIRELDIEFTATLVVSAGNISTVEQLLCSKSNIEIISPDSNIYELVNSSDIVISAAGTSAWEICTLQKPSVLIAAVENQVSTLGQLTSAGCAVGIISLAEDRVRLKVPLTKLITELLTDLTKRLAIQSKCELLFDGLGKYRIVSYMENMFAKESQASFE